MIRVRVGISFARFDYVHVETENSMKIETVSNHQYASQRIQHGNSTVGANGQSSFAAILSANTAQTAPTEKKNDQVDFTSMTRQELADWMNSQIRSGEMSLDDSSPFLGMTVKISATTGQLVDMGTDSERINFIEKARQGYEGALSRNDQDLAERLKMS